MKQCFIGCGARKIRVFVAGDHVRIVAQKGIIAVHWYNAHIGGPPILRGLCLGRSVIIRYLFVNSPEDKIAGKSVGAVGSARGFGGGYSTALFSDLRCNIAASTAKAKGV